MSTDTHPPGRLAIDDADGLLRVRIVNPARYNAMSLSMWEALGQAVRDAQGRDDLRAIVLEGEGERAFVSGADISEFASQRKDPAQIARYDRAVTQAQQALSESAVPTIALVRGICMGGGMGLALACDLRYCNESARFRMPAARLGLGYALDGVKRMCDMLGAGGGEKTRLPLLPSPTPPPRPPPPRAHRVAEAAHDAGDEALDAQRRAAVVLHQR
uniref:enoyl-CoA hydratase-related protein n=1 Tax=Bordetella pertussis TaxID=520 RepID=UPI0036731A38